VLSSYDRFGFGTDSTAPETNAAESNIPVFFNISISLSLSWLLNAFLLRSPRISVERRRRSRHHKRSLREGTIPVACRHVGRDLDPQIVTAVPILEIAKPRKGASPRGFGAPQFSSLARE
jgi:hypothetical protein